MHVFAHFTTIFTHSPHCFIYFLSVYMTTIPHFTPLQHISLVFPVGPVFLGSGGECGGSELTGLQQGTDSATKLHCNLTNEDRTVCVKWWQHSTGSAAGCNSTPPPL